MAHLHTHANISDNWRLKKLMLTTLKMLIGVQP